MQMQQVGTAEVAERIPGARAEVPAVAAAIRILRHLAAAGGPLGVTPLARALGLNTSTCFNILRTLVQGELVRFDPEAKTYALDFGLVDLARAAFARGAEVTHVLPMMRQLALRHGVTVTLWRPGGHDRMMLEQMAESDRVMRIRMGVGQRLPLLIGAMGRIAGAFGGMTDAELRRRFEGLRWQRPFSFEDFLSQVEDTRRRGWALDDGHYVLGVTTLSAPVAAYGTEGLSVVSATMFGGQHDAAALERIGAELVMLGLDIRRAVCFD
jgi:DNA-binding IclR family transcriptional regulator